MAAREGGAAKKPRTLTGAQKKAQKERNKLSAQFIADAPTKLPGGYLRTPQRCLMSPLLLGILDARYNGIDPPVVRRPAELEMSWQDGALVGQSELIDHAYRDGAVSVQWTGEAAEKYAAMRNARRGYLGATHRGSSSRSSGARVPLYTYTLQGDVALAARRIFDSMQPYADERETIARLILEYRQLQDSMRRVLRTARGQPDWYPTNINSLSVTALRRELGERSMETTGTKEVLVSRLESRLECEGVTRRNERLCANKDAGAHRVAGSDAESMITQISAFMAAGGPEAAPLHSGLEREFDRYQKPDECIVQSVRERLEQIVECHKTTHISPLTNILPPFTRQILANKDSGLRGRGYSKTTQPWKGNQGEHADGQIQELHLLVLDRELLMAGGVRTIDGLFVLLEALESLRFPDGLTREVDKIVFHIQDAFGTFMNTYSWHEDGGTAEAGGVDAAAAAMETVILCAEGGFVNLQVAGFKPIAYRVDSPSVVGFGMDVAVQHRSFIEHIGAHAASGNRRLVQRKLVVSLRQCSAHPGEQRVNWQSMAPEDRLFAWGRLVRTQ